MSRATWAERFGTASPPGAAYLAESDSYNFSIFSRHATRVTILFYTHEDTTHPRLERDLDPIANRTGGFWHCRFPARELTGVAYYAYRIDGPRNGDGAPLHAFDPDKVLFDPYARSVCFPPGFERAAAIGAGKNDGRAPLAVLPRTRDAFDWKGDRPVRHEHDLVIYELHVRGFTRDPSSGVSAARRGTFLGVIDKIPYLRDLGVTAVELMPVFQFDPQEGNYWGYMPLSFFAAHRGYAAGAGDWAARDEFREMVRALHAAGIEVLIDTVHNHTGEGDTRHPTYSLKGIDNSSYYMTGDHPGDKYKNFTGTGNTLNTMNGAARRLVVESMREWVEEMHVDGFRHDLAAIASRRSDASIDPDPPIPGALGVIREMERVRHIVEPWDPVGAYLLGSAFPAERVWQWNAKFRDEVRRFVRGDGGMVSAIMQRMYGSDDLFPDRGTAVYRPVQSVNYVCSHDGMTLYDSVSYTQRRNLANGHDNQDGPSDEVCFDCGTEGDDALTPEVLARRVRRAKSLAAILLLSAGTPMIRAGDEFLQTQGGNSNPYNQDNTTSWLDWRRLEKHRDVHRFFTLMIRFRAAHPSIGRNRFWRDDVRWFGATGGADWSHESRRLAYCLSGASEQDDDLYVMLNMSDADEAFVVQTPAVAGRPWRVAVDTGLDSPSDIAEPGEEEPMRAAERPVRGKSVVVLVRAR